MTKRSQLLADPPLIWKLLAQDDPGMYEEARKEQRGDWLFAKIFGRKTKDPSVEAAEVPPPAEEFDLDKS